LYSERVVGSVLSWLASSCFCICVRTLLLLTKMRSSPAYSTKKKSHVNTRGLCAVPCRLLRLPMRHCKGPPLPPPLRRRSPTQHSRLLQPSEFPLQPDPTQPPSPAYRPVARLCPCHLPSLLVVSSSRPAGPRQPEP
jgi:hypothetical protein